MLDFIFYRYLNSIYVFSMFNTPRLKKELNQLLGNPPIGIQVDIKEGSSSVLEASKYYLFVFIF